MSDLTDQPKPATRPVVLLLFAIAVVASAGLIGNLATIPNIPVWYAGLNKPGFTPPNWVFGPVWSLLYAMMVLAFTVPWRQLPHQLQSRQEIEVFAHRRLAHTQTAGRYCGVPGLTVVMGQQAPKTLHHWCCNVQA